MQIAIQSFVFWELKNLFGVARELNGKAPHHPSPHDADEKLAWDWDMCGFYDSTFWEKYTEGWNAGSNRTTRDRRCQYT